MAIQDRYCRELQEQGRGFNYPKGSAMDTKDTWQADKETDVLLAQLRGDPTSVVDALKTMSVAELANLGQHLYSLQGVLARVATAKSRGLEL